ncbi:MAG TPA: porin [Polyangiaceae bacterium]
MTWRQLAGVWALGFAYSLCVRRAHGEALSSTPADKAISAATLARPSSSTESSMDVTPPLDVHAFVSQGFIKTNRNNYLVHSQRGSFEFAEAGINFTKELTDKLRVGLQLFAHDLGPIGNYNAKVDWFYLDYRFWDWLGIRAGRTKIPFGLYNETSDIDAARVPILLPQSVYPITNRDYLLAQTGVEAYGLVRLGDAGGLEYRAYGGTIYLDPSLGASARTATSNLSVPYIVGGRLMWQTPMEGLQAGVSAQALRVDFDYILTPEQTVQFQAAGMLPADFSGPIAYKLPIVLGVGSIEYAHQDLLVAAEYSRWWAKIEPPLLTTKAKVANDRFYAMASYHVTPWFTPGVYYSLYYPDSDIRHGRAAYQHDAALTVRFDLNAHWLLKLEEHYMYGAAGLDPNLNGGTQLSLLPSNWGVFLAKTTAYF